MYKKCINEGIRAKGRILEGFDKDYLRDYLLGKYKYPRCLMMF